MGLKRPPMPKGVPWIPAKTSSDFSALVKESPPVPSLTTTGTRLTKPPMPKGVPWIPAKTSSDLAELVKPSPPADDVKAPRASQRTNAGIVSVWRELSEKVQLARATPHATAANEDLKHELALDPQGPLAPLMLLWMGDSLFAEAQFEEAAAQYQHLARGFPDRQFDMKAWPIIALEKTAASYDRLGETDRALATLADLARHTPAGSSSAHISLQTGIVAEGAGRLEAAAAAYERAAAAGASGGSPMASLADLANRARARLRSSRRWMRASADALSKELSRTLVSGNTQNLAALASPTHSSLGPLCGESIFMDSAQILDIIAADLPHSRVRADPLALVGGGPKRYLVTDGWSGRLLRGRVVFCLLESPYGWEWRGIGLIQFPREWTDIVGPPSHSTNQSLDISIKAPWPRGQHFRAGGILAFAAANLHCLLSFAPFDVVDCLAWTASPCGFGPGGLYYNGVPGIGEFTHTGDDAFAIDFASFVPGIPLADSSSGKSVLAVQQGVVINLFDGTPSNTFDIFGSVLANNIVIRHFTDEEAAKGILMFLLGKPQPPNLDFAPYESMYYHLEGPNKMPVSKGMWVRQGARLGRMDWTGTAVAPHLHFSIHDARLPATTRFADAIPYPRGKSVRASLMDGQSLLEKDDGRCCLSTNDPFPP